MTQSHNPTIYSLVPRVAPHLEVVGPDGVEERGPAVARVPEAVEEDHRGRLLDPRLEDHWLE